MCTSVIKLCLKDARCACLFTGGLSIYFSVSVSSRHFGKGGKTVHAIKRGGGGQCVMRRAKHGHVARGVGGHAPLRKFFSETFWCILSPI